MQENRIRADQLANLREKEKKNDEPQSDYENDTEPHNRAFSYQLKLFWRIRFKHTIRAKSITFKPCYPNDIIKLRKVTELTYHSIKNLQLDILPA